MATVRQANNTNTAVRNVQTKQFDIADFASELEREGGATGEGKKRTI